MMLMKHGTKSKEICGDPKGPNHGLRRNGNLVKGKINIKGLEPHTT
jgi:hypothetical protein